MNLGEKLKEFAQKSSNGMIMEPLGFLKTKKSSKIQGNSSRHCYVNEDFNVAGIQYYLENIHKLACSNKLYRSNSKAIIEGGMAGQKIWQYSYVYKPVELIPEPKNPHDKNAIAVHIAGQLVGYISRDDNVHVKEILSNYDVKYISAFVSGGKYKIVFENLEVERLETNIHINIRIRYAK